MGPHFGEAPTSKAASQAAKVDQQPGILLAFVYQTQVWQGIIWKHGFSIENLQTLNITWRTDAKGDDFGSTSVVPRSTQVSVFSWALHFDPFLLEYHGDGGVLKNIGTPNYANTWVSPVDQT